MERSNRLRPRWQRIAGALAGVLACAGAGACGDRVSIAAGPRRRFRCDGDHPPPHDPADAAGRQQRRTDCVSLRRRIPRSRSTFVRGPRRPVVGERPLRARRRECGRLWQPRVAAPERRGHRRSRRPRQHRTGRSSSTAARGAPGDPQPGHSSRARRRARRRRQPADARSTRLAAPRDTRAALRPRHRRRRPQRRRSRRSHHRRRDDQPHRHLTRQRRRLVRRRRGARHGARTDARRGRRRQR